MIALLVRRMRANPALPPHQLGVLRTIERLGPQTASQLATHEHVRPQSMAHTLKQLDQSGFLVRSADPSDRRQTLIALSDSGLDALRAQRRDITEWLAAAIDERLEPTEVATLATAVDLLNRLVEG